MKDEARSVFADKFAATRLVGFQEYRSLMHVAGFSDVAIQDLSSDWTTILHERLAMYRSLESETVERFGREPYERYIRAYEFFVEQIDSGALGGGRFVGWKH